MEPNPPSRRDWLQLTVGIPTNWSGTILAFAISIGLLIANFEKLRKPLNEARIEEWLQIVLLLALPLFALIFSIIPRILEYWRVKRYSEIRGPLKPGYFNLGPRESEEGFDRADKAHEAVLSWILSRPQSILYLTGASGTGKTSILSAWVIPRLRRETHVVIEVRGYERIYARIKEEVLKPGAIWEKPTIRDKSTTTVVEDLGLLLDRATQRLARRKLFIIIDQFEESLIHGDTSVTDPFFSFLAKGQTHGATFLLVFRPEYEGLMEERSFPNLNANRKVLSPFTESAALEFLQKSGLTVDDDLTRRVLREATEIEGATIGLIRPVTINLCGLVLSRFAGGLLLRFRRGIIRGFLRESLAFPEVRDTGSKVLPQLITANITKKAATLTKSLNRRVWSDPSRLPVFVGWPKATARSYATWTEIRKLGRSPTIF